MLGFYGVLGALYGELLKPDYERSNIAVAIDVTVTLMLAAAAIHLLRNAYLNTKTDHVSDDQ